MGPTSGLQKPRDRSDAAGGRLPRTMQAAVFTGAEGVRVEEVPVPEPAPGEVLVRLEGSGICHSNLPVWEGRPWFQYPLEPGAPGHEGWGTVAALGAGVRAPAPGTRVALLSGHAYAEYDRAPAEMVVPLPPVLEGRPVPGEPIACAMNIFRRSRIVEGETVAIIGIGFLGALLTELATRAGARVIAISRRESALSMARWYGAVQTIAMLDRRCVAEKVLAHTQGKGCPCVIEAVGAQVPIDLAGDIVSEGGRIVIAGYHQEGLRQVNMQVWNWKGIDVINAHEREAAVQSRGLREAVAALARAEIDPAPLLTFRFGLHELQRAFEALRQRPDGFFKGIMLHEHEHA